MNRRITHLVCLLGLAFIYLTLATAGFGAEAIQ